MTTTKSTTVAAAPRWTALWWWAGASFPAMLWYGLWVSINTGPWCLRRWPDGLMGWQATARSLAPLLALFASLLVLGTLRRRVGGPKVILCWLVYSLVSAVACYFSPQPPDALYWSACYLAVISCAILYVQGADPFARAIWLNRLSWMVASAMLLILLAVCREAMVETIANDRSGYSVYNNMRDEAGSNMSRSSGMARFAAVPGVVALVQIMSSIGWRRIGWGALFLGSGYLVYFMQSRGAMLAFAFSSVFVLAFHSAKTRIISVPLATLLMVLLVTESFSPGLTNRLTEHLTRGQDAESLTTLTGRTQLWENAWVEIKQAPLIGRGPQADRWLIGMHVHNTYFYSLMSGGFVGTAAFVAGLFGAWMIFLRAHASGWVDRLGQRDMLTQVGGILAFFTVRSIPEVCGPMFGVDLMVMVPALMYLGMLERVIDQQRRLAAHSATRRTPRPMQRTTVRPQSRSTV